MARPKKAWATGNKKLQAKGMADKVVGSAKEAVD